MSSNNKELLVTNRIESFYYLANRPSLVPTSAAAAAKLTMCSASDVRFGDLWDGLLLQLLEMCRVRNVDSDPLKCDDSRTLKFHRFFTHADDCRVSKAFSDVCVCVCVCVSVFLSVCLWA